MTRTSIEHEGWKYAWVKGKSDCFHKGFDGSGWWMMEVDYTFEITIIIQRLRHMKEAETIFEGNCKSIENLRYLSDLLNINRAAQWQEQ